MKILSKIIIINVLLATSCFAGEFLFQKQFNPNFYCRVTEKRVPEFNKKIIILGILHTDNITKGMLAEQSNSNYEPNFCREMIKYVKRCFSFAYSKMSNVALNEKIYTDPFPSKYAGNIFLVTSPKNLCFNVARNVLDVFDRSLLFFVHPSWIVQTDEEIEKGLPLCQKPTQMAQDDFEQDLNDEIKVIAK